MIFFSESSVDEAKQKHITNSTIIVKTMFI